MNDRAIAQAVSFWFDRAARDLPWRREPAGGRDPYRVLVSELMLQQTQASRVAERYDGFLAKFPDVRTLASADVAEVLAAWSGLGYYRRARHLQAAARAIANEHAGRFPRDAKSLAKLPGVGPYTAGAVASIAHGLPEPIVDGNVARVLLRFHGRGEPAADRGVQRWAWSRAHELVHSADRPGVFNEGLMELGATVCTPRSPRCEACPLAGGCVARETGRQGEIPPPSARAERRPLFLGVVLAIDGRGRRLVERRPERGLWGGLWQAPSLERDDRAPTRGELAEGLGIGIAGARPIDRFDFLTTHREVRFKVWRADGARAGRGRVWKTVSELDTMALGSPQRRTLLDTGA